MIKIGLVFIFIFTLFFVGIQVAQKMTGKEALALTKAVGYSIVCTVLAVSVLISVVILF
jgi:hypothetical protein